MRATLRRMRTASRASTGSHALVLCLVSCVAGCCRVFPRSVLTQTTQKQYQTGDLVVVTINNRTGDEIAYPFASQTWWERRENGHWTLVPFDTEVSNALPIAKGIPTCETAKRTVRVPEDLPPGWYRIGFNSAGHTNAFLIIPAAKHTARSNQRPEHGKVIPHL